MAAIRAWLAIPGNTPTLSPEVVCHQGREFSLYLAYRIAEMPERLAEVQIEMEAERMENWRRSRQEAKKRRLQSRRDAWERRRVKEHARYLRRKEKMRATFERLTAAKTA